MLGPGERERLQSLDWSGAENDLRGIAPAEPASATARNVSRRATSPFDPAYIPRPRDSFVDGRIDATIK